MDTTTAARGGERTGSAPRLAARAAVVAVVVALAASLLASGPAFATVTISGAPLTVRAGAKATLTANPDPSIAATHYTFAWSASSDATVQSADQQSTQVTFPSSGRDYTVSVRVSYLDAADAEVVPAEESSAAVHTNAPPTAQIVAPLPPATAIVGQQIALHGLASDAETAPLALTWDDGSGVFASTAGTALDAVWTPQARGAYTLTFAANDGMDSAFATTSINVVNQDPYASFVSVAGAPTGNSVPYAFDASGSTDPEGDALTCAWDFDVADGAQGYVSGPCVGATHSYARRLSPYTVALRVRDGHGGSDVTTRTVVAGDQSPSVALTATPNPVAPGIPVTLTATASDPDGDPLTYRWDVNGTRYTTPTIPAQIFQTPGTYKVTVEVTDQPGATASDTTVVFVTTSAPPPAAPTAAPETAVLVPAPVTQDPVATASPKLIDPFPIVRIRGRIFPRYTKFDVFSIRAPKGATVRVRCKGPSCPRKWSIAAVKRRTHWVRFRPLERNMPAGTVLEIFVEKQGLIGKYTRFIVRAGQAPSRRDRCVKGSRSRVVRCPAG